MVFQWQCVSYFSWLNLTRKKLFLRFSYTTGIPWLLKFWGLLQESLYLFSPMFHFYNPLTLKKTKGFLIFSAGIKIEPWAKYGSRMTHKSNRFCKKWASCNKINKYGQQKLDNNCSDDASCNLLDENEYLYTLFFLLYIKAWAVKNHLILMRILCSNK